MLTERAISILCIILGSRLVSITIAGEVTDCQTSVTREGGDLGHWSWRTIEGKQCWYRGARWKPKHELRWAEMTPPAAPSAVGQPENDNRTDGLGAESDRPQPDGFAEVTSPHAGPTAPASIDNALEEWRAQFADLWPEAFKLMGNVELGDARPDVRPAQPLWPIVVLPLVLLAMWQLVRSRAFASHGPSFDHAERRTFGLGDLGPLGRGKNIRRVAYRTTFAAMWGAGMALVVTHLLDFIDGAPRLNHSFFIGGMLAAFDTAALAEEIAKLLGIRKGKV